MSIEGDRDLGYTLICDICGEEEDGFDDFYEAVDGKKELDWISRKINGEWRDICQGCKGDYS